MHCVFAYISSILTATALYHCLRIFQPEQDLLFKKEKRMNRFKYDDEIGVTCKHYDIIR